MQKCKSRRKSTLICRTARHMVFVCTLMAWRHHLSLRFNCASPVPAMPKPSHYSTHTHKHQITYLQTRWEGNMIHGKQGVYLFKLIHKILPLQELDLSTKTLIQTPVSTNKKGLYRVRIYLFKTNYVASVVFFCFKNIYNLMWRLKTFGDQLSTAWKENIYTS